MSLARALLKDPELLILDEATSALDRPSEARILAAVDRFARGRAVLSLAHRLSSVQHADLIVVLEAVRIVERVGMRSCSRWVNGMPRCGLDSWVEATI